MFFWHMAQNQWMIHAPCSETIMLSHKTGKNHPVTWCHISEERRPHLQCCEGLKSHTLPYTQLRMPKCNTYDNQYGLEFSFEVYQSTFGLLYDTGNISD
jgi:hypothetical protein